MKMNKEVSKIVGSVISFETLRRFWEDYSRENKVGNNRERHNVIHRHAFMHIARENVALPLQRIGKILGKDHATVLHACRNHEMNYKFDGDYRVIWDNLNRDVEDLLMDNGIVPKTIASAPSTEDIHFRYLDISRKLRVKIKEFEDYKLSVKKDLKKIQSIKKYIKGLETRNHLLDTELKRVKNLL